jgi:predicted CXXCH cytochrome family protein
VPLLTNRRLAAGARPRIRKLVALSAAIACIAVKGPSGRAFAADETFRLRPGARGSLCLECHGMDFELILKKPHVHTPVKALDCSGCHNPHTARRAKLFDVAPQEVCANCHDVVPAGARSRHKPVAESRCTACHDPHASQFPFNLLKSPAKLCASCHGALAAAAARARVQHPPVVKSCTLCHDPHASASDVRLLKGAVPELCVRCHRADRLAAKHMGYPVARGRCTTCHDPHGSEVRGMLQATVHPPVARRNCSQCHVPAGAARPFQTRAAGVDLCRSCHTPRIASMLERSRVHWPVAAGDCFACHAPHASQRRGLLRSDLVSVCGTCHRDTVARQARSPTRHPPVADGACAACHDPHSSERPLMLTRGDPIVLCGSCHDWGRHASHPLGPNSADPRNPNLTLDCLSCHRAHGTENEHLTAATRNELCTVCHGKLWK